MNPTQQLHDAGQSLWLDSINRKMLQDGTLSGYIDHLALTGLTSNPTILGHAMAAGSDYGNDDAGLTPVDAARAGAAPGRDCRPMSRTDHNGRLVASARAGRKSPSAVAAW